ncbi:MAG: RuBisCO large subunit C-terminal-like domain-containing protein [Deltaproteobacteria bacterium]|nr:RuBisCO large subunit C-terminal-like domain-containing protein [Deltaproteobacteria bacterium]
MGLSAAECAELAGRLARAGIDIIKDDHGLTDQPFARFEERVVLCAKAVRRANWDTGGQSIYMPNVSAPADELDRRVALARHAGAGGLMIAPGLVGFDTVRRLSQDDRARLPIMAHPSFLGGFTTQPESGLGFGVLYGTLSRLAGADAVIFPNYGGRFSFSREDCAEIAAACAEPLGRTHPIFPTPRRRDGSRPARGDGEGLRPRGHLSHRRRALSARDPRRGLPRLQNGGGNRPPRG